MAQLVQISDSCLDRFQTLAQPQYAAGVRALKLTLVHGQVLPRWHCARAPNCSRTLPRSIHSCSSRFVIYVDIFDRGGLKSS